jgi:hypothetical protein
MLQAAVKIFFFYLRRQRGKEKGRPDLRNSTLTQPWVGRLEKCINPVIKVL